jgi:hypothetical protein
MLCPRRLHADGKQRPLILSASITPNDGPPMKTPRDGDYICLPFGKHKGQALSEIPTSYLEWCQENLEDLRPSLADAIAGELLHRWRERNKPTYLRPPSPEELLGALPGYCDLSLN